MATPRKNTKFAKRRRLMKEVDALKAFNLKSGEKVNSIYQLAFVLETMNDDIFRLHVNNERNDFSTWVKDVFGEAKLAAELLGAQDKKMAQITVLKHIVNGLL